MTQAIWNGTVIADSDDTTIVEGNHYFPADSVRWEHLQDIDRQTTCHWKGSASYYDIVLDGKTKRAAAWQYRNPSPAASNIKDHVAFGGGVRIERTRPAGRGASPSAPGLLRRLFAGGQS